MSAEESGEGKVLSLKTVRRAIPKKVRFEVFKRDSFKCQYCGASAPEVVLVVDHIDPVSRGGDNGIMNLVTACDSCNSGKGATPLGDSTALAKQRTQMEALQERREQLELLMEWQRSLIDLDTQVADELAVLWSELVPGWHLNETGMLSLKKLLPKYGAAQVAEVMRESVLQYLRLDSGGKPVKESVDKAWDYVARILRFRETNKDKPYMRQVLYVRAMVRNSYAYCNEQYALDMIEEAYLKGHDFESLKRIVRANRNWTNWCSDMDALPSLNGGR